VIVCEWCDNYCITEAFDFQLILYDTSDIVFVYMSVSMELIMVERANRLKRCISFTGLLK